MPSPVRSHSDGWCVVPPSPGTFPSCCSSQGNGALLQQPLLVCVLLIYCLKVTFLWSVRPSWGRRGEGGAPQDAQCASASSHTSFTPHVSCCSLCWGPDGVIPVGEFLGMPGRAGSDILPPGSPRAALCAHGQPGGSPVLGVGVSCPASAPPWNEQGCVTRAVSPGLCCCHTAFPRVIPPLEHGHLTQSRLSWGGHRGGSFKMQRLQPL